jgi:hypothetical protein
VCEQHSTARSQLIDINKTIVAMSHVLWAHTSDLHPILFCGPKLVKVHVIRASNPPCVARYSSCHDKHVERSTLGYQHVCTIALLSTKCIASNCLECSDTKNGMMCAFGVLTTCLEIQPKTTGEGHVGRKGQFT